MNKSRRTALPKRGGRAINSMIDGATDWLDEGIQHVVSEPHATSNEASQQ